MEGITARRQITLSRRVYNEHEFKKCYVPKQSTKKRRTPVQRLKKHLSENITNLTCKGVLFSLFPILNWLPKYSVKDNMMADIAGGLTVAVLHIPQGLAYAMLASVPAITGLYLAFVPLLVYVLLGTSRHLSLGTFAVVCLMIGTVVEREVPEITEPTTSSSISPTSPNLTTPLPTPAFTNLVVKVVSNSSSPDPEDQIAAKKMEVAVTLAFLVGIIQFLMGILRLGFVAVYLSDPLVSGFTTGASILVFTSQVKHVLGLKVPRYSGVFATIKTYIYMFSHANDFIPGCIMTGVVCIVLLLILKKIDEKTRPKIKFPIPADLIAVVAGTAITYGFETHKKYDVAVLGFIPKGIPPITIPKTDLMTSLISDAFVIGIVIFATNISLAKMFAKRNNYTVDANQELFAYGTVNIIGSFFSCFPASASLSRSAVQETIAKTLMCNFPVVAIILLVLLFAAPLFYTLPKAVLAAVVIVALKGLFRQFSRFCELWKICKYDATVWLSAWLAVVILGIDTGLAVGIIVALLIVLVRSSRPRSVVLGHVPHTGIYRDLSRFPGAKEFPGIKIFRFEAALFYANAEFFRNELIRKIHLNPDDVNKNQQRVSYSCKGGDQTNGGSNTDVRNDQEDTDKASDGSVVIENVMNGGISNSKKSLSDESFEFSDEDMNIPIHTVIVDCSTFNFIDTQGVNLLIQLSMEFKKIGVNFYLASCRHGIREMLYKAGFTEEVGIHHVFISVHDAVVHARHPNDEVEEVMSIDTEISQSPPLSTSPSIIIPTLPPCPEEDSFSSKDDMTQF